MSRARRGASQPTTPAGTRGAAARALHALHALRHRADGPLLPPLTRAAAGIVMMLFFASLAMWTVYLMVVLYLDHKNRRIKAGTW